MASLYTTSIPTATDAGTYYVWYKVIGDDNHNNTEPANVSVTIAKANATVITAPSANNRTYNGTEKPLLNSDGKISGGTMLYALGTAATAPTEGWSADIPTAINTGTYYVWFKVAGDENHNDCCPSD